jgi:hypothetical protein
MAKGRIDNAARAGGALENWIEEDGLVERKVSGRESRVVRGWRHRWPPLGQFLATRDWRLATRD